MNPGLIAPSGKTSLSADGVARAVPGWYYGYIVTTVMSANASTIYDNASAASGTVIDVIPASSAAGTQKIFPYPIPVSNGIYVDIGGTGTVLFLHGE